jgi:hypothetical protein
MAGKQVKKTHEKSFLHYGFFRRRNSSLGYQRQTKLRRNLSALSPFDLLLRGP